MPQQDMADLGVGPDLLSPRRPLPARRWAEPKQVKQGYKEFAGREGLVPRPRGLGPCRYQPAPKKRRKRGLGSAPRDSISGMVCGGGPVCVVGDGHGCGHTVGLCVAQAARDTRGSGDQFLPHALAEA